MIIQGFQKVTLLDFPSLVAATIFTYGCNMRCPFCHNPELVVEKRSDAHSVGIDEIFAYLEKRKNLLGGVCITGGEPLLHDDLADVMEKIRSIGLKIKLDTNGTLPDTLKKLKPDYIAMDIKTSPGKYGTLGFTGNDDVTDRISESIRWMIESGIEHEFRTTVVPELVTDDDIREIIGLIKRARLYVLAQFRNENLLDHVWELKIPYKKEVLEEMKKTVMNAGIKCVIRANY
jgi:pyruvate formate lyase activating enzyme